MAREPRVILASASAARRGMLAASGVAFETKPANVDEERIRKSLCATGPKRIALRLAKEKALAGSVKASNAIVIGSDQVLALGREVFAKPRDLDEARRHLWRLRGETHDLLSAVAIARNGDVLWSHAAVASLTMRRFSHAFLSSYLASEGDAVCASVGGYRIEGAGVQLFKMIEGDHFTILGMPLLPLLAKLRRLNVVMA